MDEEITLYHNPRCSKSQKALELLRERGIEPVIVEYLCDRPNAGQVLRLIELFGGDHHALVRASEPAYAAQGLDPDSTADEVARAVAEEPVLLQRPILIRGRSAVLGRPPERIFELLDADLEPAS